MTLSFITMERSGISWRQVSPLGVFFGPLSLSSQARGSSYPPAPPPPVLLLLHPTAVVARRAPMQQRSPSHGRRRWSWLLCVGVDGGDGGETAEGGSERLSASRLA